MDAPSELRPDTMGNLVDMVANGDSGAGALGYSVFYYATQMYLKDTAKLVAIDGVAPTTQSVSDGSYPYGTYYYAVLRHDTPADDPARVFVNWLLSDAGQRVASQANYVPLDPSNIVTGDPVYYLGATADNTSASSGTGGTQRTPLSGLSVPLCDAANTFTLSGHPEVSQAVNAWLAQRKVENPCWDATVLGSLVTVNDDIGSSGTRGQASDGAVFDVATGKQLSLSDLFYNGTNYIDYINNNLFNMWTNQPLQRMLSMYTFASGGSRNAMDPDYVVTTPFTGLPNDYASFHLDPTIDGIQLDIDWPQGDPFVAPDPTTDANGSPAMYNDQPMPLPLPANLSPYGDVWRLDEPAASPGSNVVLPSVTTDFPGPGANDAAIDSAITAAYQQASGAAATEIDIDGSRLTVAFWDKPFATYWQPGTILSMVTIDMATGQPAPYGTSDIPAQWWTSPTVNVIDVAATGDGFPTPLQGYTPPAGSTYQDIRVGIDGVKFNLVEPSGRVLRVTVSSLARS
jgi:hypothetical protein